MIEKLKVLIIAIAMISGAFTMSLMASDDSSVEDDGDAGGNEGDESDGGGDEEADVDDADDNAEDDAVSGGSGEGEDDDDEGLGDKLADDFTSGGIAALDRLLDGDVDGATDALVQTGLDVEDDALDTAEAVFTGKAAQSCSAASRRMGALADDEDEEVDATVFGKATSSAGTSSFLHGLDMSQYGKSLIDYAEEYPYLLRHTAQASLYAYSDERNTSLKGSLEEDGWEISSEADKWITVQNGGLCVMAYTGTEDLISALEQGLMGLGYKNYASGTLKTDFKGALSVGVKQGYADLFDRETGGVRTVVDFVNDADEDTTFIFTGHSKGGIFAQIAGIIALGTEVRNRSSVIAYGVSPIFSSDGARVINEMSHAFLRISKDHDPVVAYNPGNSCCNGGALYSIASEKSAGEIAIDEDAPSFPGTKGKSRDAVVYHAMKKYMVSVYDTDLSDCLN